MRWHGPTLCWLFHLEGKVPLRTLAVHRTPHILYTDHLHDCCIHIWSFGTCKIKLKCCTRSSPSSIALPHQNLDKLAKFSLSKKEKLLTRFDSARRSSMIDAQRREWTHRSNHTMLCGTNPTFPHFSCPSFYIFYNPGQRGVQARRVR